MMEGIVAARKKAETEETGIVAYKGFDKDLACRGFQYKVGKTYVHDGDVVACDSGFHVVTADNPLAAFGFYPPKDGARYAEVRYSGATASDGTGCNKLAVEKLTVSAELSFGDFVRLGVKAVIAKAKGRAASGYSSTGAASGAYSTGAASGYSSTGAASGDSSTGAASGDSSTGAASGASSTGAASGYYSTGAASGYYSTGAASGYSSTGAASGAYSTGAASGYSSTGAASGYYSTGAASGDSSTGAASGYFSTAKVTGKNSIAVATGIGARASASHGSGFVLGEFDKDRNLVRLHTAMAGKDGIEADTLYTVRDGALVLA